jgi:hypothetical protein
MGEANAQGKGKGKGKNKGKGKAKGNPNSVRDGPPESAPVRELAAGRHGADHWDDLRRAWAGYLSQPKKGKGGYQPHHPYQHNHGRDYHPPRDQQPESSPVQSNWNLRSGSGGGGSGDHAQAGQKRKGKAKATNGTADDGGQRAAKRHKGNPGPSGHGAGVGGVAEPHPHPDFWHPDGSVIIEVGKTRFCLHQSTLQKNSTYFADAFQKRGGHQGGGKRTQLPVYRVDETTAEDFVSLLTIIEEPMCVVFLVPS